MVQNAIEIETRNSRFIKNKRRQSIDWLDVILDVELTSYWMLNWRQTGCFQTGWYQGREWVNHIDFVNDVYISCPYWWRSLFIPVGSMVWSRQIHRSSWNSRSASVFNPVCRIAISISFSWSWPLKNAVQVRNYQVFFCSRICALTFAFVALLQFDRHRGCRASCSVQHKSNCLIYSCRTPWSLMKHWILCCLLLMWGIPANHKFYILFHIFLSILSLHHSFEVWCHCGSVGFLMILVFEKQLWARLETFFPGLDQSWADGNVFLILLAEGQEMDASQQRRSSADPFSSVLYRAVTPNDPFWIPLQTF